MPRSLRARLLLAFAFVIVLSLAISAIGTLLLLRDQQREAAQERLGRLAAPITLAVALMEEAGVDPSRIETTADDYARSFDTRVLLVDANGRVVVDTDGGLEGQAVEVFDDPGVGVKSVGGVRFRMAQYSAKGDDLLLFAPPEETVLVTSNRLLELQRIIFDLSANTDPALLQELLKDLPQEGDAQQTLPLPSLRPLVAVSQSEISSAWEEIIPQLAIAAAIALAASAVVAALISRSVTGRLARVTDAAREMAKGRYGQQVDLRGDDEVGELAQAFNVMSRQVSQSHQMMRDLLANVSHELKTPLTSIQGFSQALEEGAIASPDEYRQAGRIINEETQRMRRLVDDLIDLSRLESGQAVMERHAVDVEKVLRDCAQRFEWQLRDSHTQLRLDVGALPAVEGDGARLEQAFSNLLDNAARHTPAGGEITVRAAAENGVVRVAVHNTGSYIPPEELPRVFERFFQIERHRSRGNGVGGAGLGLAIAQEVVQAHKGAIRATSDREQGTEFEVTLPASGGRS